MELKEMIKSNKNVSGITMWDAKNGKAVIRYLKDDEILIEDMINRLINGGNNIRIVKTTGGFNNPEKNIILSF